MFSNSRTLILVLVGLGLVWSTAVGQEYERTVQDTVSSGVAGVSIDTEKGRVSISPWTRDSVAYRARIVSDRAEAPVGDTRIAVQRSGSSLSLSTDYSDVSGRWSFGPRSFGYVKTEPAVQYTLRIPTATALEINDEESQIDVSGLSGSLTIETEEGTVTVRDHAGSAEIDAEEGRVDVTAATGALTIRSERGFVTVDHHRGPLDVDVVSGEATLAVNRLEETVIETQDGSADLSIPKAAGFDLSADFGDGARLRTDLDLKSVRRSTGTYQGAVQGGGPLLRLASESGDIKLWTR